MSWTPFAIPERLFLGAAFAVVLAFFYNLSVQLSAVPASMRYVPPESAAYIITSPLGVLWTGSSPHLGSYFEGASAPGDGALRSLAQQLKSSLDAKSIKPREARDLAQLGIDPGTNAMFAFVDHGADLCCVLMSFGVIDKATFVQTFGRVFSKSDEQVRESTKKGSRAVVYHSGKFVLAFGDDGAALISDSVNLLHRVLESQSQNLAYFQSSDRYSTGFTKLIGRQGSGSAWIRGSVKATAMSEAQSPGSLFSDVQFALGFDAQAVTFRARGTLPDVRSELLSRLLAPRSVSTDYTDRVLDRNEAVVSVADDALPYYFRYLSLDALEDQLDGFNSLFPGLLNELRQFKSLSSFSLSTREPTEHVPGVVVGLVMSEKEADELLFRLQSSLRLKRDRQILRAAARTFRGDETGGTERPKPITVDGLLAAGAIHEGRDELWRRYRIGPKGTALVGPEPALARADFRNSSYVERRNNLVELRYVMPPFTDDDVTYRLADKKDDLQVDDLKRDRFRLCSAYFQGTLWLGNDAGVLTSWIQRATSEQVSRDYQDVRGRTPDSDKAKLSLFASPNRLLEAGQLYPDSVVNEQTRRLLDDLRQYRSALLVVTTRPGEREINAAATFAR